MTLCVFSADRSPAAAAYNRDTIVSPLDSAFTLLGFDLFSIVFPSYRWKEKFSIRFSMNFNPLKEFPYLSRGGDHRQIPMVLGRTIIMEPATLDLPGIPTFSHLYKNN